MSRDIKKDIEEYGLHVVMIPASDYLPSFAFSIGLVERYGHPEVICFGLPQQTAHTVVNGIAEMVKEGQVLQPYADNHDIFEGGRATFLPVDPRNLRDYFGSAIHYYGHADFPALELIWTDRQGRYPWEEEFEEDFEYIQPLLDRNAEFKFREPRNLGVFTSRQWLEEGKPILTVAHDHEGDWQFLTGDEMDGDGRLVALEQLILRDETLNDVFDLEYGEIAERSHVGGEWERAEFEAEEADSEEE